MSQVKRLLEKLGITGHDAARENLLIAELIELNLAITIDNHFKIKKIMDQFQDFVSSLRNENAVIANLGTAVAGLATTLQQVKTQLDTASAQGMHIPAQQAQELSDLIGKGTSDASTALATAQAALTPATPATDPNAVIPATGSGTDAGSTSSDSGGASADPNASASGGTGTQSQPDGGAGTDGSAPSTATDALNG